MTKKAIPASNVLANLNIVAEWSNHFLMDTNGFTVTGDDANVALTIKDQQGGWAELTTGDDSVGDNDGALAATAEIFKFDSSHAFRLKARMGFTPSGSDVDNILAIGLQNAPTANTFLGDSGAGPPADYWGANVFKLDGGTKWIVEVSHGTTQKTLTTDIDADATIRDFEIVYTPTDSGRGQVSFYIDGNIVTDPQSSLREVFAYEFSLTSAEEMAACFGVKAGSAAEKAADWDYVGFAMAQG